MSFTNPADELHDEIVRNHSDLWLYIIEKYKNASSTAIVGLGDLVVSPLIELSNWGFPITYVNFGVDGVEESKKAAEKFAGEFSRFYHVDFIKDFPKAKIALSIGVAENLPEREMVKWFDLLLRRCHEVIFPVPIDRDWNRLLSKRYDTLINKYRSGNYYLICLTKKYEPKKLGREMEERGKDTKANSKTKILREK